MALSIPSFANPHDPANPIKPAYAWLSCLALDLRTNSGRVTLSVHPNEAAWQATPLASVGIALGEILTPAQPGAAPPVAAVTFPRLDELLADPDVAAAFNMLGAKIYQAVVRTHPEFAGSTPC